MTLGPTPTRIHATANGHEPILRRPGQAQVGSFRAEVVVVVVAGCPH